MHASGGHFQQFPYAFLSPPPYSSSSSILCLAVIYLVHIDIIKFTFNCMRQNWLLVQTSIPNTLVARVYEWVSFSIIIPTQLRSWQHVIVERNVVSFLLSCANRCACKAIGSRMLVNGPIEAPVLCNPKVSRQS